MFCIAKCCTVKNFTVKDCTKLYNDVMQYNVLHFRAEVPSITGVTTARAEPGLISSVRIGELLYKNH